MSGDDVAGQAPPGIALAYQTAVDRVASQLAALKSLDDKAGILWGVLGATIAALAAFLVTPAFRTAMTGFKSGEVFAPSFGSLLLLGGLCTFGAAFVYAYLAVLPTTHYQAVSLGHLVEIADETPKQMKHLILSDVLESVRLNEAIIGRKVEHIRTALHCAGAGVLVLAPALLLISLS
jgi:hypothetical protein